MRDIAGNPPAINQREKIERLFWEAETALLDIEEIINESEGYSELIVYQDNRKFINRILTMAGTIKKKANDQLQPFNKEPGV